MTDAELIECARGFRDGILDGHPSDSMCFVVCAPLVGYLCFLGVECETVEVDLGACNHFYIRLADGRALDPTADQFGNLSPVYLGPPGKYQGCLDGSETTC